MKKNTNNIKLYTGRGDFGKTGLFSGERVPKSHDRIEACGDIDELNSVLGGLRSILPESFATIGDMLINIQTDLVNIGSWLSTTPDSPAFKLVATIGPEKTRQLEEKIDSLALELPPLKDFVLPGGHPAAALSHVARTVCRRAERQVVRISTEATEGDTLEQLKYILMFLNRLSAYFFAVALYLNIKTDVPEIRWTKEKKEATTVVV